MGYDIRFYVVNKSKLELEVEDNMYKYGEIVASYEYCVDYDLRNFVKNNSKPTDTYIYVDGKETVKDCYGEFLYEISIDSLLNRLEEQPCMEYRRYWPLVALLRGFKEVQDEPDNEHFENLVVLMYGH